MVCKFAASLAFTCKTTIVTKTQQRKNSIIDVSSIAKLGWHNNGWKLLETFLQRTSPIQKKRDDNHVEERV
jgi:hypothetical protein